MASQALTTFNAAVDGLAISNARKADVKVAGERLYIAGVKEAIAHLRKHAIAVRDDVNETTERRQRAAALVNLINDIASRYQDAWWIDISELV